MTPGPRSSHLCWLCPTCREAQPSSVPRRKGTEYPWRAPLNPGLPVQLPPHLGYREWRGCWPGPPWRGELTASRLPSQADRKVAAPAAPAVPAHCLPRRLWARLVPAPPPRSVSWRRAVMTLELSSGGEARHCTEGLRTAPCTRSHSKRLPWGERQEEVLPRGRPSSSNPWDSRVTYRGAWVAPCSENVTGRLWGFLEGLRTDRRERKRNVGRVFRVQEPRAL